MSFLQYSIEGVNQQSDTKFFDDLTEEIRRVLEGEIDITDSRIVTIIKERMGLNDLRMFYVDDDRVYAGVNIPPLSLSHVHETIEKHYRELDIKSLIKGLHLKKSNEPTVVDRQLGRVSGLYSAIPLQIQLSRGLFEHRKTTPEMISAIILHEMGHVFSYFETLHTTVSTNMVISSAMEELVGQKEGKMRIQIVNRLIDEGVLPKTMSTDKIDRLNDNDMHQLILTTAMQETVYRQDSPLYDMTMCEQQADAFVVRMGGGKYLAEAIKLLSMELGEAGKKPNHWFIQLMGFIVKSALFLGPAYWFTAWVLHQAHAKMDTYGGVKSRLEHIKREAIRRLKVLDSVRLEGRLLSDIEAIDEILKKAYDDRTYLQRFFTFVTPFLRAQQSKKEQQKAIEDLLDNDLYYTSLKLKQHFGE